MDFCTTSICKSDNASIHNSKSLSKVADKDHQYFRLNPWRLSSKWDNV